MKISQLVYFSFLLFITACGGESAEEKQQKLLIGKWDLVEGKRNDQVTNTLEGTYFEFTPEGKMSTNLPIKGAMNSPYSISDNKIIQTIINDIKIEYAINKLDQTSLELATNLKGYDFIFSLEKQAEEAIETEEQLSLK
jgi:hypothetical protein